MLKKKNILIIVNMIAIIIIIGILFYKYFIALSKNDVIETNDNDIEQSYVEIGNSFVFNRLIYSVPINFKYEKHDSIYFKIISNNDWYALACFYMKDEDDKIDDIYDNEVKQNVDVNIDDVYNVQIDDVKLIAIKSKTNKEITYLFESGFDSTLYYKLVVYYTSDIFDDKEIGKIMESLQYPIINISKDE